MNVLRRAIAGEILPSSSSSPTKSSLFTRLHPQNHQTFPLQEPCCLYSTATTTSPSKSKKKQVGTPKTTKTSKTHKENPPKLPRTWAEAARQLLVHPPEKAELQKGQAAGQAPVVPPEKAELQKGLNGEGYRKDLPRPSKIQWQKKAANSVNLIGRIQIPVQLEASQDGKYWAGTIISEANAGALGNSAFWIPIIFEGYLAHIAACHLKPTDYVHIAGELFSDPPPFALKEAQGSVQVMVHNINFVHESSQAKNTFTSENPEELDKFGTNNLYASEDIDDFGGDPLTKDTSSSVGIIPSFTTKPPKEPEKEEARLTDVVSGFGSMKAGLDVVARALEHGNARNYDERMLYDEVDKATGLSDISKMKIYQVLARGVDEARAFLACPAERRDLWLRVRFESLYEDQA